jgi:hypothetical protein
MLLPTRHPTCTKKRPLPPHPPPNKKKNIARLLTKCLMSYHKLQKHSTNHVGVRSGMLICPIFCPASFSPLSLHLQCHQWLVDQTPRTAARNGVRNNAFWFIIPTFTAPFASLHQGIVQVACYDSFVVCIVHILITYDKDQFQSKTCSQQSSEGY